MKTFGTIRRILGIALTLAWLGLGGAEARADDAAVAAGIETQAATATEIETPTEMGTRQAEPTLDRNALDANGLDKTTLEAIAFDAIGPDGTDSPESERYDDVATSGEARPSIAPAPPPGMRTGYYDFGHGPVRIAYRVVDRRAIFQGDVILGPAWAVASHPTGPHPPVPAASAIAGDRESDGFLDDTDGYDSLDHLGDHLREGLGFRHDNDGPDTLLRGMDTDASASAGALPDSAIAYRMSWPGGRVPFAIDERAFPRGTAQYNDIVRAINDWNRVSLASFVPRSSGEHYVFITSGDGCSAALGNQAYFGSPQTVELARGCDLGAIRHELGHSLGLLHEHTRADRDSYVNVNYANIQRGLEDQFERHTSGSIAGLDWGPFDYDSIMIYDSFGFAINRGVPTLNRAHCAPSDASWHCLIQRSDEITPFDIAGATRQITGDPATKFRLTGAAAGECLAPSGGRYEAGTSIVSVPCRSSSEQRWYQVGFVGIEQVIVVNERSRMCVTRSDGGRGLTQEPCSRAESQRFTLDGGGGAASDELPPVPSAYWRSLRSGASYESGQITFVNTTSRTLYLYWVDGYGRTYWYGTVTAGGSFTQGTYSEHAWVLATGSGTIVAAYIARPGDWRAIIR